MQKYYKKLVLVIIILIFSVCIVSAIEIGDSFEPFIKNSVKSSEEIIYNIPESKISYYSIKLKGSSKDSLIKVFDKYWIGVLLGGKSSGKFAIDIDGDKIIDEVIDGFFIPPWVIEKESKKETKNANIYDIMDMFYKSYQSNEGPASNPLMIGGSKMMIKAVQDKNSENRYLYYLLYLYTIYNQKYPMLSMKIISFLGSECDKRFDYVHPLIFLYTGETLINMGHVEDSKVYHDLLRKMDPEFIPGKVYEYQYETDKKKRKELYKILKKNHSKHWIVKRLMSLPNLLS